MKLEYAISLEDFRALQMPFSRQVGASFWFKGTVVACTTLAALGIFSVTTGYGTFLGWLLVGVGAVGVTVGLPYELRSVRRAKQEYERHIAAAYEHLHCRDRRVVETDEVGLTLTCRCGVKVYRWSEFTQFAENGRFFQLVTKVDSLIFPKSAFTSFGDQTEFRRLATEPIQRALAFAPRPLEVACTKQDYRSARLLHILRGGGWRRLAPALLLLVGYSCILTVLYVKRPQNAIEKFVAIEIAVMFALVAFFAFIFIRGSKLAAAYRRPLRMSFGAEGLHFQDGIAISKNPWEAYCGYLESGRIYLLYYNAKLYRVIPKRALGSRESEFRELLQRKVSPFDFRYPFRLGAREVSRSS